MRETIMQYMMFASYDNVGEHVAVVTVAARVRCASCHEGLPGIGCLAGIRSLTGRSIVRDKWGWSVCSSGSFC